MARHREIFELGLPVAREEEIRKGQVDMETTMLRANASMKKSLVRCRDVSSHQKHLKTLATAHRTVEPTTRDPQQFDKETKGKKLSNNSWESSTDCEARITKMTDSTTRLAYKADDAADLPTSVTVGTEPYGPSKVTRRRIR